MANTKIVDNPVLHQLRMEKELRDELDEIATFRKKSRNQVIIDALMYLRQNEGL